MRIIKYKDKYNTYIKIENLKGLNELDFLIDFLKFLKKDRLLSNNVLVNGYENSNKMVVFYVKGQKLDTDIWVYAPATIKWSIDVDDEALNELLLNHLSQSLKLFFEATEEKVELV